MLSDYRTITSRLIRDDSGRIDQDDLDDAIEQAVVQYSKDRPRKLVEDVTADGSTWLDLPESWQDGISALVSLEYPVGEDPLSYLEEFDIYQGPEAEQIYLHGEAPADGAAVRATFTVLHEVVADADSIPITDRQAVCCLAASLLCEQLATAYAGDRDSTILSDSVDHQSKSRDFATRANQLRKRYTDFIGIEDKTAAPAGEFVDWDGADSRGQDRLFHPRRYR